jgi:hypothetical protein
VQVQHVASERLVAERIKPKICRSWITSSAAFAVVGSSFPQFLCYGLNRPFSAAVRGLAAGCVPGQYQRANYGREEACFQDPYRE